MPRPLIVLLPPSEAKQFGGGHSDQVDEFGEQLRGSRREVARALGVFVRTSTVASLEKTLKVRGALLDGAVASSRQIVSRRAPLLPAWRRYNGVVWSHLDLATLRPEDRRRLLVPSGLYGVTTGEDHIADYRLKMDVQLAPLGNLASFWRSRLTLALESHLRGTTVINLLPREHEAALDLGVLGAVCEVITVPFLGSGGDRAAGHGAKAVKGVFARQLLQDGPGVLDTFRWEGWRMKHFEGVVSVVTAN